MDEISIAPATPELFEDFAGPEAVSSFAEAAERARTELAGRTTWHVNSVATGGGVAEILTSVLGYLTGAGITTRWLTIGGDDPFFEVTKRIHHFLHGMPGDGGGLGPDEARTYESSLAPELVQLVGTVQPRDVVVLHDPQTLGLAPALSAHGAVVIWNCHVGCDEPNDIARSAWAFLAPYLRGTAARVFSRRQHVWDGLDDAKVAIIPPCIDALSPKNRPLDRPSVSRILDGAGIQRLGDAAPGTSVEPPALEVRDTVAEMLEETSITPASPLVVQISRWDPLKDHSGVLQGFVAGVPDATGAHLLLVGPSPGEVADDPEGPETYRRLAEQWEDLPPDQRSRVHIANLPLGSPDEHGLVVNAIQRRADVIVQKSLAEGFGLTVTEAMWKARPVVASRVGGIQDQIESGSSGLLVDPRDLDELGRGITYCLSRPAVAERMGVEARRGVASGYLAPHYLSRHLDLAASLCRAA